MRYLSLFSGIEAASLAFAPLGWTPVAFAEIDPFACAVLAHRYPDVPNLGDVTTVDWSAYRGAVDLVVAGSPCQAFSVAGLRRGLDDPRGNLTLELLRVLDRVRPRFLVWENVPGVLSQDGGRAFGTFLGGLEELGFRWAYRIMDAQFFHLAQRRQRVFLVGYSGASECVAPAVLFERASLRGDPAPRREARTCVAALSATGVGVGSPDDNQAQAGHLIAENDITGAVAAKWAKGTGGSAGDECDNIVAHALRADGFDASEDGTRRGTPLGDPRAEEPQAYNITAEYSNVMLGKGEGEVATQADVSRALDANGGFGQGQQGGTVIAQHIEGIEFRNNTITGEVAATLQAKESGYSLNALPSVLAFHGRQDPDVSGEVSHPLDTDGHGSVVAFDWQASAGNDTSWRGKGRQHVVRSGDYSGAVSSTRVDAVAYGLSLRGRDDGSVAEVNDEEVSHALRGSQGGGDKPHVLAFQERSRDGGRSLETQDDVAYALTSPDGGSRSHEKNIAAGAVVRRLTPREAERLMGLPDDWTLVPHRGKPAADGPRYRAIGNSIAVPVLRWIGQRIQLVEDILQTHAQSTTEQENQPA